MKRMKKHKPKPALPETSSFRLKDNEEHDLAYYIHDRVELMHQVFSVIKTKELKAMIPQCVKNISLDDLQELCTEELLGISSKRLCAILDGAEPPSDTESSSSSPEQLETISLDSISSDDEVLSQGSSKNKKHKHKKQKAKNKQKRRESENNDESSEDEEKNRASRAGLTVLELLELQARARAIRAQLQKDQINNKAPEGTENTEIGKSDDEVEIKEEPAEVVEISSEDEKPDVDKLNVQIGQKSTDRDQTTRDEESSTSVTKRINDLIITVPQTKQTRKIKLNRNKVVLCETTKATTSTNNVEENKEETSNNKSEMVKAKDAKKPKAKKKDKNRKKSNKKDGSDHDEITLQLSDTEKMDLLEDLDRKNYDSVSSSSKDSENSSQSSDDTSYSSDLEEPANQDTEKKNNEMETTVNTGKSNEETNGVATTNNSDENLSTENEMMVVDTVSVDLKENKNTDAEINNESNKNSNTEDVAMAVDLGHMDSKEDENSSQKKNISDVSHVSVDQISDCEKVAVSNDDMKNKEASTENSMDEHANKIETENNENKSDGEISEHSDAAAITEVVCLSDEEKTKKKKEKKSKKKSKKSNSKVNESKSNDDKQIQIFTLNDEDENEIFELSDDGSSCYEVEGVSVLSKEPTTIEIAALSAKVDDTIREEIGEVEDNDCLQSEKDDVENISWKDRYLDSKKVKHVLKTSKILNALRKKNKELKKKLEDSKKIPSAVAVEEEKEKVEGTIDEYNNLEGSTKYVDPVTEKSLELGEEGQEVTKEMEKDAKQLLKMYKKLLKYNDMNRQKTKDPNRKKSNKSKKKKEKHKDKGSGEATSTADT